jgi:hypothetical protein
MNRDSRRVIPFALVFPALAAVASAQQPAPELTGVAHDAACATVSPAVRPSAALTIAGGRESNRMLFAPGDEVIVRGGGSHGVRAGDEYFVRRIVADRVTDQVDGRRPISVHTAGVVRIVEAQANASIAVVTHACDGISENDYLERFTAPSLPQSAIGATPDFSNPARVILGAERRQLGSPGAFMALDRGSDQGIQPGQLLTVFRPSAGAGPPRQIGTARVYAVLAKSSTLRIEQSVDAVYVGDLVAVHR